MIQSANIYDKRASEGVILSGLLLCLKGGSHATQTEETLRVSRVPAADLRPVLREAPEGKERAV